MEGAALRRRRRGGDRRRLRPRRGRRRAAHGADELAAAKTAWLEARKTARSSDGAIAGQLASNLDLGRSMARVAEEEQRIESLTPQEVQDAFRRHIDPDRLIIIRAGDFRR